jgi:mono/diheme cytochrome c family protein
MTRQNEFKDEIDFRDLARKPRKLIGFGYIYFFILFVVLGIAYAWNLNAIGKNSVVPLVLADSSAFIQDIPMQAPSVMPPVDVLTASHPTPELIARGREVFKGNCASCHGDNGAGDGQAGIVLNPRPRNFHQATGWTNSAKISEIYRTLEEGITRNGMPSFSYLPPADRFAVIHLVRSFHPAPPADSDQDIAQLESTYQLSKGKVVSAQIPVRDAMKRIAAESAGQRTRLEHDASVLVKDSHEGQHDILARVVSDPSRFLLACRECKGRLESSEEFIQMVSHDPTSFGVQPMVAGMTKEEWLALQRIALDEVK